MGQAQHSRPDPQDSIHHQPPSVAIGGIGGSGTRIVAEIARALGIHTGSDLNSATDTLWFTLLLKHEGILDTGDEEFEQLARMLEAGLRGGMPLAPHALSMLRSLVESDRPQHPATWLRKRAQSLVLAASGPARPGRWGWKEPNTHLVIERLWQLWPDLKYVHVVRHGLDMAYSSNQNQLGLWGARVLGTDGPPSPARSLAYWCRVHQRIQRLSAERPGHLYWLDYDALCRAPEAEAEQLCDFLQGDFEPVRPLLTQIRAPGAPRHAGLPLDDFDPAHLEYLHSLGYAVVDC